MWMPDCPKSKAALDLAEFNHRPALAEMQKKLKVVDDYFADDAELSQDISNMTLRSFLKGCLKK